MTSAIKNDSKSAKNRLKTQKKIQKFQLKKLASPVIITQKKTNKFLACPVRPVQISRGCNFIKSDG